MQSAPDALVGRLVQGCPCKTAHFPHAAGACARPLPPVRLSGCSPGAEYSEYSTQRVVGALLREAGQQWTLRSLTKDFPEQVQKSAARWD